MRAMRAPVLSSVVLVSLIWPVRSAQSEPFTARHVVRATFDMKDFVLPPWLASIEALDFSVGLVPIEVVGSYTTRVFDRGRLLGSFTAEYTSLQGTVATSRFVSARSTGNIVPATVIDFTSVNDHTFDGVLEFTIERGLADVLRTSDELTVGRAFTPFDSFAGVAVRSFEITRRQDSAPVPEPATLGLLALGVTGTLVTRRRRRNSS